MLASESSELPSMVRIENYAIGVNMWYDTRVAEVAELSDKVGTGAQSYGATSVDSVHSYSAARRGGLN